MAAPTGTLQTYQAIGNREDLSDIIYSISPMDTPFMSNVARGTATSTLHEWQTDSLDAAALNAQIEGDDPAANTAVATIRLANRTQIAWKVPRVTTTQREVTSAGRKDEMSYQIAKRGKELKRDVEKGLLGLQAATAGVAASARVAAGVAAFLWNNQVASGTSSTTPTVTSGAPTTAPTAGTAATFVVGNLKSAISACWDDGGDPGIVLLNSFNKKAASGFEGIATLYREAPGNQPATVVGAADVYVSDFGQHQIVADRFCPTDNVYLLDMEYWSVDYLYPMRQETLAKTGHSDRVLISCEYTLCAKQPDSSAKIYTTTTS